MPDTTTQAATRVVRKDYFRSELFFLSLFLDLIGGGVALCFLVLVSGLAVFYGMVPVAWQVLLQLGVQNVPLIQIAIQIIAVVIIAMVYALFWRHLLLRVKSRQSVVVRFSTIVLASTGLIWVGLLALATFLVQGWAFVTNQGAVQKLWELFVVLPLVVALTIGGLLGRTLMLRHWTRNSRLVVETVYGWRRIVRSRRLLAMEG